jgi:hypothetical protein
MTAIAADGLVRADEVLPEVGVNTRFPGRVMISSRVPDMAPGERRESAKGIHVSAMAASVTRRDRRDLALLGLLVLAFGLVVAPLLHRFEHGDGHTHHHGSSPPDDSRHGEGSLEHQLASFTSPSLAVEPVFFAVALEQPHAHQQQAPSTSARWTAEQPQGP